MDAISFVLGIKSSHLRSTHLRDLVYRGRVMKTSKIQDDGTAAPATNGQSNGHADEIEDEASQKASRNDPKTAWVMAVYEDDAGDEQKWKRSITNQGASEYRINDRVVTAQQYNDALESENILIKARNFLVFQGDVEAIAAQSPQDLTRLIEQISGSLEYKTEYERLQTVAEEAAENQNFQLHRRRGINSEIKQYQEQKKEAENYQKKTEERDEAEMTLILWKLYHFQRLMDESSNKIQEHQENLKLFRRNVEVFERNLEAARKEQASVTREVTKIEKSMHAKEKSIEEMENSLVPLDEKIAQTKRDMEDKRRRVVDVRKERDTQAAEVQKLKKDLATVEKAQQRFEKEWTEKMRNQGKELSDADRREYNSLRAQAMSKSAQNQAELANLVRQLKSDEVTVNSLKGKIDNFEAALEKHQGELQSIKDRRETTQETVRQASSEIDAKKNEYNKVKSERIRINNMRTELEEKLQDVLRKLADAESGRRQNEKENRTREMVNSLKRMYPGVRGRIGDLCKPKQKKYDEAVSRALGREFDAVIVETEKTGMDCVQYLKDQRFSPMTFIPLDNIKFSASNAALKSVPGARLTIDTIEFDLSLERAMSYACGGSVVCDSMEVAKNIVFDRRMQVKAVTLDGSVLHKAGLMTIGRLSEDKNKHRFQEQDIDNLQNMAEKFRSGMEKLPRADRAGFSEESLLRDLTALEQRVQLARAELDAFEKNVKSKQKEIDHQKRQLKEFEPKYKEKSRELESTRSAVDKFQKAVAKTDDKIFADFCQRLGYENIRAYEEQQGGLENEAAQKRQDFEVQKGRVQNKLTWEESRHKTTQARVSILEADLLRHEKEIDAFEDKKAAIDEAMGEEREELEALEESLDEVKATHGQKAAKVAEAKSELQKKNREIEGRLREISTLEAEVQKNSAGKLAQLRKCRLNKTQIPLLAGSLDDIPDNVVLQADHDAMDVDREEEDEDRDLLEAALDDHGIEIDFDGLDDEFKNVCLPLLASPTDSALTQSQPDDDDVEDRLQEKISSLTTELDKLNPNMRAIERLESVKSRLEATEQDFEDSRAALKGAKDAFNHIKDKRFDLFQKAFAHIQEQITHVYKDLTRSDAYPLGGQAYLDIEEDTDAPYLSGIKYHAMPPLKRFRDMEHLSGGEKTMAAMALLFAIHSYQPSPFFVLDEVDAALDNANVDKIKKYIREHAGPGMQFIVISLKAGLFQDSESLIGVYRDQDVNSSKTLTLDVSHPLFRELPSLINYGF